MYDAMNGFEDLHSQILLSLASVLANEESAATSEDIDHFIAQCPSVPMNSPEETTILTRTDAPELGVMTERYKQALEAFIKYTLDSADKEKHLPRLISYLRHLPAYTWEEVIPSTSSMPADGITYALVLALFQMSEVCPEASERINTVIWNFANRLYELICSNTSSYIASFILPSLAGFARAVHQTPYLYKPDHLITVCGSLHRLLSDPVLAKSCKAVEASLEDTPFTQRVFAIYMEQGSPFGNNLPVYDMLMTKRNILIRVLAGIEPDPSVSRPVSNPQGIKLYMASDIEAAWTKILEKKIAIEYEENSPLSRTIRSIYVECLEYYEDVQRFAQVPDGWKPDFYMEGIMGVSLQLAALSSVYLRTVDTVMLDNISSCLLRTPTWCKEARVYASALDTAGMLATNFRHLSDDITQMVCRFLSTPSQVFELTLSIGESQVYTVQEFAIKRIAQCVQSTPAERRHHATNSLFHYFLNAIVLCGSRPAEVDIPSEDHDKPMLSDPSLDKLDDEEKQKVSINALSIIVGLAVHLTEKQVISQSITMLLYQSLNMSETATTVMVAKLVDLALVSQFTEFRDIVNLIVLLCSSSLTSTGEKDGLYNAAVNALYDLGERLTLRPEYYQFYLTHICTLFIDIGVRIENMAEKAAKETPKQNDARDAEECPFAHKLTVFLPVLRVILDKPDFQPQESPSGELVSLFRNVWFYCVLYGFTSSPNRISPWYDTLLKIAQKTPVLVTEFANEYLETELEYNSVLRRGTHAAVIPQKRQNLATHLPTVANYVKSLSVPQVVFVLSVYHVEMLRSQSDDCSYVLRYFISGAITQDESLRECLEAIMDSVLANFLRNMSFKAGSANISSEMRTQLEKLLVFCCHRLPVVHKLAMDLIDRIVVVFPQAFADKSLITILLELLQLLWQSCEAGYRDQYSPSFRFSSQRIGITVELGDSQAYRQQICTDLYNAAKRWLIAAMKRAPFEINGLLQDYLAEFDRYGQDRYAPDGVHLGRSLALEIGKSVTTSRISVEFFPQLPTVLRDESSNFVDGFTTRRHQIGQIKGIFILDEKNGSVPTVLPTEMQERLELCIDSLKELYMDAKNGREIPFERLYQTLLRAAAFVVLQEKVHPDWIRYLTMTPVFISSIQSMDLATHMWNWIMVERHDLQRRLLMEIIAAWSWARKHRKGIFSPLLDDKNPFEGLMTYTPSDSATRKIIEQTADELFTPFIGWIQFIMSCFCASTYQQTFNIYAFLQSLRLTLQSTHLMSTHPLSRYPRFQLLLIGLKALQLHRMEAVDEYKFRALVYHSAFLWFELSPKWHYGSSKSLALREYELLLQFYDALERDTVRLSYLVTAASIPLTSVKASAQVFMCIDDKTKDEITESHENTKKLLLLFLESELSQLSVWLNPLNATGQDYPDCFVGKVEKSLTTDDAWKAMVRRAWQISPRLAIQMKKRFLPAIVTTELRRLISNNMLDAVGVPEALGILFGDKITSSPLLDLKYLRYWAPVPAITAASYFSMGCESNPYVLQYAMRSLEYYPVDTVFFYIPQIVQALRYDKFGYIEKYIKAAAQESQLFAHQIIWNMQANYYVDADRDCSKPDPLKPKLEQIVNDLINSFEGRDREFYESEFRFFQEITMISGYLKEYTKYGQHEKKIKQKQRLDEELGKIKLDVGVYLPSHPDGRVIDISRTSGKPLQSHAKAPFMATFRIEQDPSTQDPLLANKLWNKDREVRRPSDSSSRDDDDDENQNMVWQAAIFKVGDDCRQDVLALQLIAVFKSIFTSVGLDLYVYPYRVVATAPGCGIIDVLPRSISRDQLGREKVNSIYDYFVAKYGDTDSIAFQRARSNFVQSLAAYSVILYLLQIKDRHNGNIMIDDDGHILHIDFGFIFDIAPGGITFESSPFKLTTEMVQVMGGGTDEQPFRQFSELVVKAYLATRPHAETIMQLVSLMLDSGLPCFRGETIKRFRSRFQLDRTDRAAADFMMMRIKDSFENQRTVLYDYFQKLTNGIPY